MTRLRVVPFILLLVLSTAAPGGSQPGHLPAHFQHAGTIGRIDPQKGEIVVSDILRQYSPTVVVYDRTGGTGSLRELGKGMEIGYQTQSAGTRGGPISEIWILPKGYLESQRGMRRY